jgi:hypothetical protein
MRLIALATIAAIVGRTAGIDPSAISAAVSAAAAVATTAAPTTEAATTGAAATTVAEICTGVNSGKLWCASRNTCVSSCTASTCNGFEADVVTTPAECKAPSEDNCKQTPSTQKYCPDGSSSTFVADKCVNNCAGCTGYTIDGATCKTNTVATNPRTQKTTKKTSTNNESEDDKGLSDGSIAALVVVPILLIGGAFAYRYTFAPTVSWFSRSPTYAFVGADGEALGRPTGSQVADYEAFQEEQKRIADMGLQF